MPGEVQDVRIKFVSDTSGLKQAEAGLRNLSASEREAVKDFQQLNQTAGAAFRATQAGAQTSARSVSQLGDAGKDAAGKLKSAGQAAKGSFDGVGSSISGLQGAISGLGAGILAAFALDSLSSATGKILEITSEFQKYRAVLTNVLGSQQAADIAMQQITGTAAKTNFSVSELTNSYVKLANMNLKPTQKEFMQLADLANASGKSIDMLTEAVLDANSFEFERLKEFGIRAKKEGDNIEFTFKNKTETIAKTSEAVNAYILSLGKLEGVSGSTAAISQTLGGQISNLGDSFDQLFVTIGNGSGGALSYFVEVIGDAVTGITRFIKGSEQLRKEAELAAKGAAIEGVGERVKEQTALLRKATKERQAIYDNDRDARISALKMEKDLLEVRRQELSKEYGRLNEAFLKEQKRALAGNINADPLSDTQVKVAKRNLAEVANRYRLNAEERREIDRLIAKDAEKNADADAKAKQESLGLVNALQAKIKELGEAQGKAFTETDVKKFGLAIKAAKEELERLLNVDTKIQIDDVGTIEKQQVPVALVPELDEPSLDAINLETAAKFEQTFQKISQDVRGAALDEYYKAEEAREKALMEKRLEYVQTFYDVATTLGDAYSEIQDIKNEQRAQAIQEARDRELKLVGDNEQAKAFIAAKFDSQEKALKTKQARQDRDKALFDVAINTAVAIGKTLATLGVPVGLPFAGIAAAQGALQAALILARPLPKFKKGTKSVPGFDMGKDSVFAMLQPGEGVMPTDKMKEYRTTYDAMFDGKIPGSVINKFVLDYSKGDRVAQPSGNYSALLMEQRKTNRLLELQRNQPVHEFNLNKKGFETYIRKGDSVTEILNNQFPL